MTNINNVNNVNISNPSHDVIALIPAYNEEENIEEVVRKTIKQEMFPLVVDDGSTDRTAELASKSGAKVIKNDLGKGKAYAMRKGLEYIKNKSNFSDYKCVVIIDADLQYRPEEAKKLINPILKGKKIVKGSRNFHKIPFRHMLGNMVWRKFYNIFSEVEIKDPCCGFIALSKEVVEKINLKKLSGGYIGDSSLLFEITNNGFNKEKYIEQPTVSVKYKNISPIGRGIRMVLGVLLFILMSGLKRKLGIAN